MKKHLFLAVALIATCLGFSSCSDDNDLPNVDFTVDFEGGVVDPSTGTIYVVQGDELEVTSITVHNLDSDKNAGITGVQYYWDYNLIGISPVAPFGFSIATSEDTAIGTHALSIQAGVVAVDKEPAFAVLEYPVEVVASPEDIPVTDTTGTLTTNQTLTGV